MKQQQPSQEEEKEDMEEDNLMKEVEKENQEEEDNLEEEKEEKEKEAIVVSLLWPHILQKPLMKNQQKRPQQTMLLNLQSPLGKKRPQKQIYPQLFKDNLNLI